jgi:Putative bacterial sensory transduction regulator
MIEQFGPELIERFLKDNGLRYLVDQDGDYWISFYDSDVPDYRATLAVEGADRGILCIRMSTDVVYSDKMREPVEGFVAGWNRRMRWPKTYLADDPCGRGFRVIGANAFPLAAGVHQGLLNELIASTLIAGRGMLIELAAATSVAAEDELETWVRETG